MREGWILRDDSGWLVSNTDVANLRIERNQETPAEFNRPGPSVTASTDLKALLAGKNEQNPWAISPLSDCLTP